MYKIPPLKDANGQRADDWDLANPLQTCSLLVERRADQLVLEFRVKDTVFAQSTIDCTNNRKLSHYLDFVRDSSRYFTLKISKNGREATIGFGFRDRDQATDLRESLQHYENSIRREQEASEALANAPQYHIPKLKEGEKIHVNTGRKESSREKKKSTKKTGVPLLKKPPPSPPAEKSVGMAAGTVQQLAINMSGIDLDNKSDQDDSSNGAVYEGDEEEWATEFVSAK